MYQLYDSDDVLSVHVVTRSFIVRPHPSTRSFSSVADSTYIIVEMLTSKQWNCICEGVKSVHGCMCVRCRQRIT